MRWYKGDVSNTGVQSYETNRQGVYPRCVTFSVNKKNRWILYHDGDSFDWGDCECFEDALDEAEEAFRRYYGDY